MRSTGTPPPGRTHRRSSPRMRPERSAAGPSRTSGGRRTGWPMSWSVTGSSRATGSRSSCPRRRRRASRTWRPTAPGSSPSRCSCCSARRPSSTGWPIWAPSRSSPTWPTGPRWPRSASGCPTCARSSWSTVAGSTGRSTTPGSSAPHRPCSRPLTRWRMTRRSSSTRRARPARPRARSTPIGSCSATCPASCSPSRSRRSRATSSGRRPTGPGSAACTTSCSRPGTGACPSSPTAPGSSTRSARWT